ncbi:acyl-CoA thioesterase [Virgibacillus salinus]|uniref:Acyl-CoA thioester hydrolase n=1 Tax=Virgibacillus salinus TaxID=553311 RepID=A0A1H1EQI2_9BACI|nr:thioesterase family protein [Virgibacillus salinus]SDQ90828.1 acyl-CoA thioester hydrolase [Virgibacillus salinus]
MDVKVRVAETDMLGHVNNSSYFIYMEETRLDFLQKLGMEVHSDDYMIVLASAKCDFVRQGYYGQTLEINTIVKRIGRTSFTLVNEISDKESGDLIANGEVIIVYFDIAKQKPAELPESFKAPLQEHLDPA